MFKNSYLLITIALISSNLFCAQQEKSKTISNPIIIKTTYKSRDIPKYKNGDMQTTRVSYRKEHSMPNQEKNIYEAQYFYALEENNDIIWIYEGLMNGQKIDSNAARNLFWALELEFNDKNLKIRKLQETKVV